MLGVSTFVMSSTPLDETLFANAGISLTEPSTLFLTSNELLLPYIFAMAATAPVTCGVAIDVPL